MTDRSRKILYYTVSILLLLLVWELLARIIKIDFAIPTVYSTLLRFSKIIITADFWKSVAYSIGRILLGFILGVVLAAVITPLTVLSKFAYTLISLIMTVIRSTPVASFILVVWVLIGSAKAPVIIALLIVLPIIWQNLYDGYASIDNKLLEVASVFKFSKKKTLKYIISPALSKYFFPAVLTSIGMAWKSGIAAEIIAYTKNSIGKEIFDAKSFFEGDSMFAWTLTVIILSLIFEIFIKSLIKKLGERSEID